jgi:predicted HicB family RNase H-like nuclease
MDEVANDLAKIRAKWSSPNGTAAKAKSNRRSVEKGVRKSSEFWTGRSEQLNVRLTPELKTAVQAAAADFGMSMAEFFETAVTELMKRGKP